MTKLKASITAIAALSLSLCFSSLSYAQTVYSSADQVKQGDLTHLGPLNSSIQSHKESPFGRIYSSTSSYYFKVGVKNFERNNLDKAEKAFEAVLRTNDLKKQAYYYLAQINAKQNEQENVEKYIMAYHNVTSLDDLRTLRNETQGEKSQNGNIIRSF